MKNTFILLQDAQEKEAALEAAMETLPEEARVFARQQAAAAGGEEEGEEGTAAAAVFAEAEALEVQAASHKEVSQAARHREGPTEGSTRPRFAPHADIHPEGDK